MPKPVEHLTERHEDLVETLDEALMPIIEIRDKVRECPPNAEAAVEPFLHWSQQKFLPHLQAEQDVFRRDLCDAPGAEGLFKRVMHDHNQLRKLMNEAREEIVLLLDSDSIREAWWDTIELSAVLIFRRALVEHIDFEHHKVFPILRNQTQVQNGE